MLEKIPAHLVLRLCKSALVAAAGFFFVLVVFDNLTDYWSNFYFVQHVLSMDDTFPGNAAMYRALPYAPVYHLFYASIILWETTSAIALCYGAFCLFQMRSASEEMFIRAKVVATVGLTIALLLWFFAFITVGGEWFLMWQSKTWNGQDAAFRMFTLDAAVLIFLWLAEVPKTESR